MYAVSVAAFFVTERYRLPLLVPAVHRRRRGARARLPPDRRRQGGGGREGGSGGADREFLSTFAESRGFRVPWAEGIGIVALLVARRARQPAHARRTTGGRRSGRAWRKRWWRWTATTKRTRGSRKPRPARAGPPSCMSGSADCCSRTASRSPRSRTSSARCGSIPARPIVEYAIGQALVEREALQGGHPAPRGGAPRRSAAQPGGLRARARPRRRRRSRRRAADAAGDPSGQPRGRGKLERARRARAAAAVAVAGDGVLQRGDRGRAAERRSRIRTWAGRSR